jgi:hypothetical protein
MMAANDVSEKHSALELRAAAPVAKYIKAEINRPMLRKPEFE